MTDWRQPRPKPSTVRQWWALSIRAIAPTLRNGELLMAMSLSGVFTVSLYLPLKNLMAVAVQGSYAQFHGDFGTQPLAGSSLGYAILLLGFWLTAGLGFAVWNLRRLD